MQPPVDGDKALKSQGEPIGGGFGGASDLQRAWNLVRTLVPPTFAQARVYVFRSLGCCLCQAKACATPIGRMMERTPAVTPVAIDIKWLSEC